jgi:hypothetical protein
MLPATDVRDVASAHIVPLLDPFMLANNGRYLISTQSIWLRDIVQLLNKRHLELGIPRVKARKLSLIEMNLAALLINPKLRELLPFLKHDLQIESSSELIKAIQRWDKLDPVQPVTIAQSIEEMAQALINF